LVETRGLLLTKMMEHATKVDFLQTDSVLEALIMEASLIQKYKPFHNTLGKDDKSYNFVLITKETFPRVLVIRGREIQQKYTDPDSYTALFGPFPNGGALRVAMRIIRRIFPYRDRCVSVDQIPAGKALKPCFNSQIGLCPGVCAGTISEKEYRRTITHLMMFFEGRKKALLASLEKDMKKFASQKEFEKAEAVKKTVFALQHIQDVALIHKDKVVDADGIHSENRIEAYDIAHLAGTSTVGVMVVVEDGEPNPAEYRMFKIRQAGKGDDLKSLSEVLTRRFNHPEWQFPSLIVIDGGHTHLNHAREVLKKLQIDVPVMKYQVLLFYKYVTVENPAELKAYSLELCKRFNLTGRVIIAEEGINYTLEGLVQDTEDFVTEFLKDPRFADTHIKRSEGFGKSFPGLSIKVRKEIVGTQFPKEVDPRVKTGAHLPAEELKKWIDEKKEVRDGVIEREFDALRIDHDEAQALRATAVQEGDDEVVDGDGFAGAGGARDEEMRHLGEVGKLRLSGDGTTERDHERLVAPGETIVRKQWPETEGRARDVRDLDTDERLSGDRCFDTDRGSGQCELEIRLQCHDLGETHTLSWLHRVAGDSRSDRRFVHLHLDAEVLERALDDVHVGLHVSHLRLALVLGKERDRRRRVGFAEMCLDREAAPSVILLHLLYAWCALFRQLGDRCRFHLLFWSRRRGADDLFFLLVSDTESGDGSGLRRGDFCLFVRISCEQSVVDASGEIGQVQVERDDQRRDRKREQEEHCRCRIKCGKDRLRNDVPKDATAPGERDTHERQGREQEDGHADPLDPSQASLQ
jgi:excinuclease ABC subunit C